MAESSSSICTICFEAVQDGRLLHCLHTFCKGCLDDLDMRTGHKHEINCPTCRSTCPLPESGAAGLPNDITVATDTTSQCHTCSTEHGDGKPELLCTTCDLAFCKEHAVAHVMATGHSVGPIANNAASSPSRPASLSARLCKEHALPARLLCQQCNIAVCGECIAIGQHHTHKPIVSFKEIAMDLKERVRRKTNHLKKARLPETQRSLLAVEEVSTEISSRAEHIRTQIRDSAKRAHDTIDLVMQQKLAEVDDLEDLRLKHLNNQHDQLKGHSDSLKSAVSFGEKLMEEVAEREDVCKLVMAVEKRADDLNETAIAETPIEHARMDFESASDETLLAKVSEIVGVLLPCAASAENSFIDGETNKTCVQGSSVTYSLVAKDFKGRRLTTGGDVIRVALRSQQSSCSDPGPTAEVVDNRNGTYAIRFMTERIESGEYSIDVFMNNDKLQQQLLIVCTCPMTFDPAECQEGNSISQDKLTVTHTGQDKDSSVLGSHGMKTGQHVWKVKITKSKYMDVVLGVAEKPGLTSNKDNCIATYSWIGYDGGKRIMGKWEKSMSRWQENDVLQLHLDCSKHTLSIKNVRSGETATIDHLPPAELYAYFRTYRTGACLALLP